ncbi:MAG: hypothetical protein ACR2LX_02590 [Jatrophihabitans sp.]
MTTVEPTDAATIDAAPFTAASVNAAPPHYVLGPATRLLWRSPDSVHLELGSRAVVVDGLPARVISRVAAPPTARLKADRRAGRQRAEPPPDPEPVVEAPVAEVLLDLADAGFLWTRAAPAADDADHPIDSVDDRLIPPSPRLAGELTSLAARHGDRAAELLDARRHACVMVYGGGRTAAHLAALLAAAGVGRVHCASAGSVRLCHLVPGGVQPRDEGLALAAAADAAIRRAAPDADTTPLSVGDSPDLTVLAVDAPIDETRRAALHAAGAAHLVVAVGVDHGVIGPLVVPGLTSCLRCADLHRRDRDPAWSALAAQLTIDGRYGPSSDVAVDTTIVGSAVIQVLTFLDGGDPACIEGTLELHLPDWRLRRRSWPIHTDCGCCGE